MRHSWIKVLFCLAVSAMCAAPKIAAAAPPDPSVEFQSEALTPALTLPESAAPITQVRLLADVGRPGISRGVLVLEANTPLFDEYGALKGGLVTPQTDGKRGPLPGIKLECEIELVKAGQGEQDWYLYRLASREFKSKVMLATRGRVTTAGPARLLVQGKDDKIETVIALTRYGLVEP
jgi:hypothetical protein